MDETPPAERLPERKPWPMTWVLVAILSYVVFYTAVNVFFRKPADTVHEPAAEARERERNFVLASMNGWTRFAVRIAPGDAAALSPGAEVKRTPAPADLAQAVPVDLTLIFPGKPSMHTAPDGIAAPAALAADGVWSCELAFDAPQEAAPLGEALAYAKDGHLRLFLQDGKRVPFEGAPLPVTARITVSLPPRVLSAGDWHATVYTRDAIFTWAFSVPPEAAPETAPGTAAP